MVTLGTGIGGGVVSGGRLVVGAHGFTGEFGHMVVDPNGPPCPCGRRGCWERYASGSGLAYLARLAAAEDRAAASSSSPAATRPRSAASTSTPPRAEGDGRRWRSIDTSAAGSRSGSPT